MFTHHILHQIQKFRNQRIARLSAHLFGFNSFFASSKKLPFFFIPGPSRTKTTQTNTQIQKKGPCQAPLRPRLYLYI